ncbi:hypothetical protein PR048_013228 [Dryococelus australis]|uniref:Uncharacterized protein n=1 Tax=Dryococelus australis TaxID=614101 RepID=A0ABQ9HRK7_9NEOP|nr:hypothetical protein PR048_013228 [Dryococelus australis]
MARPMPSHEFYDIEVGCPTNLVQPVGCILCRDNQIYCYTMHDTHDRASLMHSEQHWFASRAGQQGSCHALCCHMEGGMWSAPFDSQKNIFLAADHWEYDNSTFYVSGHVNHHTVRIWASENPCHVHENICDSPKVILVPDIRALKLRVTEGIEHVCDSILARTWAGLWYHLDSLRATKGAHIDVFTQHCILLLLHIHLTRPSSALLTCCGAVGWCAAGLGCGRFWIQILGKAWVFKLGHKLLCKPSTDKPPDITPEDVNKTFPININTAEELRRCSAAWELLQTLVCSCPHLRAAPATHRRFSITLLVLGGWGGSVPTFYRLVTSHANGDDDQKLCAVALKLLNRSDVSPSSDKPGRSGRTPPHHSVGSQ